MVVAKVVAGKGKATWRATPKISRYGLYWAQTDLTRGSEIAKTRPDVAEEAPPLKGM